MYISGVSFQFFALLLYLHCLVHLSICNRVSGKGARLRSEIGGVFAAEYQEESLQ